MKESVYLMPGMAASPKIFDFLSFPDYYDVNYLSWIPPVKDESWRDYALRMSARVKHKKPILIGVSLGGILVQEMKNHLDCKKVIIISSIKSNKELPIHMKIAKRTKAHRLLPTQWVQNLEMLTYFAFGENIQRRFARYKKYLSERDPEYLNWAIDRLVNWERSEIDPQVIHIHGSQDAVFPIKNIIKPFITVAGDHGIIITKSEWFNGKLPKILNESLVDSTFLK